MGVFGAPVAHEDDPERAVRAGLAMQEAMEDANRQSREKFGVGFSLRVGINSGEVMAGAVGDRYTVMGDAVNVAARLQAAGRSDTVTVGESTYGASREAIAFERLEPLRLKGKEEPVPAWEANGVLAEPRRGAGRAQTPLIGREEEAGLLMSLVERVEREERPHLVTVIGQAGVGKSRLLRELMTNLSESDDPPTIRRGQCPPYGAGIAYWALAEVLNDEFEIRDTDAPEAAWEKLRAGVTELMRELGDEAAGERNAALLAIPLGLEPPEELQPSEDDPQRMREALFSAARAAVEAIARRRPLVLAIDDIHWADEGMLDLIDHLTRWVRAPLLLVCLTRDELLERRPGWGGGRRNATTISLEPLTATETRELVAALMPSSGEDGGDVVPQVAERSGGNPLFAEEMVNRLLEEETVEAEALPRTVQSLLAARLDSLDRLERRLLQSASVVGQTFWEGALSTTAAEEGLDLGRTLSNLEEKDLLVPSAGSRLAGEREYAFKHVLIRDVAYSMLPKSVRCRKHVEVAEFIRERAGERSDGVIGLIAEHFARAAALGSEAGLERDALAELQTRALESLEAAGDAAAALYSNAEAFDRYTAALEISESLDPGTVARDRREAGRRRAADGARGRGGRGLGALPGLPPRPGGPGPRRRSAPQDRRGPLAQGRAPRLDRQLPARHRPAQGRAALHRARPALRGGRLALHAHRGQHARHLRLREGSAARGAPGRGARRQPGARDLRPRLRPHRRLREGAGEPGALRRPGARIGPVRGRPRPAHAGLPPRGLRGRLRGAATAYREALEIAQEVGDLPSQVELHASLGELAVDNADWEAVEDAAEASASLAEREGLYGKLCFPDLMRGVLSWRAGDWQEAAKSFRRAHELGEQVGRSEVAFNALFWLAMTLRESGDLAGAETELDPGARHLRARRTDRAVRRGDLGARGGPGPGRPHGAGARRRGGGRPARRAAALSGGRGGNR